MERASTADDNLEGNLSMSIEREREREREREMHHFIAMHQTDSRLQDRHRIALDHFECSRRSRFLGYNSVGLE